MLGLGGLVMAATVGLASVVVKAYSFAPEPLVITLCHFFDFLFALAEASCKLTTIVLLFLYNVVTHFLGSFLCILPSVFHLVTLTLSFFLWVCIHFIRGLLGLEAKALNTLSWLIALCAAFLYLENKYRDVGVSFFTNRRANFVRVLVRDRRNINNGHNDRGDNNNDQDHVADAEDEGTEMDPEQLQENHLLENENRENENEENALEEADRNRVNIDNVQNDQRELDRAEQVLPAAVPFRPVDDSSDDEIDPTLCSVCLHRSRGAALFPCGHTQLCRICARIIIAAQRPCPMCQTPIQEFRNVYV